MLKQILKRAGGDTFKYFPVKLVPAITSLVTVPVFTRLIAREEYGYFALVNSAVGLLAVVFTNWVQGSIVRLYWTYEKEGRADEYVSTAVWSAIGSLALGVALAATGAYVLEGRLEPGLMRLVPYGLLSLAVNNSTTTAMQILRAANRSKDYSRLSITTTLVGTAASLALVVWADMGAAGILLGVVIGNAVVMPFTLRSVRQQGRLGVGHVKRDVASEFLSYGLPFVPAAISSWLLVLADRYIIGLLRGAEEVGLYAVNYNLGDKLMQLVISPFLIAVAPLLVESFEKHGEELAQRAQTELTRYYAIVTFPLLAGLAVVSRHFVTVFTGPQYHESYPVLPLVSAGAMLYGFVRIAGNGITLYKKSMIVMTNMLAAAAFNVGANLLLVGRFGYMAAAWTTIASYALLLFLAWWRGRPYMEWKPPMRELARVLAASLVMAGVVFAAFGWMEPAVWVLLVEVVAGIVVYVAALRLLGGVRADEIEFVKEAAGGLLARLHR
ncbi:MAG: oligosaccharide flippase family protein [Coriobacteriia bacterium]